MYLKPDEKEKSTPTTNNSQGYDPGGSGNNWASSPNTKVGIKANTNNNVGFVAGLDDLGTNFMIDPTMIQDMRDQTNAINDVIMGTMDDIRGLAEDSVIDVGALTGQLNDSFEQTKTLMLDSALASTRKASFEMDAMLGSGGGDARSVVRRDIATGVTEQMLSNTQQNIAALYSGHIDKVIETSLAGGQINANVKLGAAKALGDLAGEASRLILGTNSAIASLYSQNLNAAVELMNAHTSRLQLGVDMERLAAQERMHTQDLDARELISSRQDLTQRDMANLNAQINLYTNPTWTYGPMGPGQAPQGSFSSQSTYDRARDTWSARRDSFSLSYL